MRMIIQLLFVSLFCLKPVLAKEFKLSDYLVENQKDATLAVFNMLQDASKQPNSKVIIEKGTYHFYPEKAYEQYVYITNHDNSMRRIAFNIKDVDGMTIDAQGATFIFHGLIMPFNIENSNNIDISNLTIDWDVPLHGEALVVARDVENQTFDLKISENMPYVIRNNQLYYVKEGYESNLLHSILYDPSRHAVAYRNSDYMPLEMTSRTDIRFREKLEYPNYVDFRKPAYQQYGINYVIQAEELEPGLVRISGNDKTPPPVGMVLVSKGEFGKNRQTNGFHILESEDVKLHQITIHHVGGMGILGERCNNVELDSVNILANPDKNLMVSATADATHFSSCKGKIIINNSNFRHQLDDATNIHGAYVLVEDILGPDQVGVRIGHFQQSGFVFAKAGENIGLIDFEQSGDVFYRTKVKEFTRVNQDYYIIKFNDKITSKIAKGFLLENLDWYPEAVITNNQFADNRARGLLLKSPKKTIVKNNYFSNQMQALLISGGINNWWYESGGNQNIIIENNTFGDGNYDGSNRPIIILGGKNDGSGRTLNKIIIRNNTFNNFNPSILKATGVKYLEFSDNTINNSNTFQSTYPNEHVIDVNGIETLKIDNVKIEEKFGNKYKIENVTNDLSNIE